MAFIPYGRQSITDDDIQSVVKVLQSDFLTQGPAVPAFEKAIGQYSDVAHVVASNSATSALHLACLALGVKAGDIVWTSPITFVASANCALYCGAKVDFVDIDANTYNISVEALTKKLKHAETVGKLPKVVIPVHLSGQPCDMKAIYALSLKYGFSIIEDASHAIGASYQGKKVGNCQFSDITIFSFHPVKIITTGEGGAATTKDTKLARKMQLLRSHGVTREASEMTQAADGPWYYQQIDLGFNYRMTDMQAALGLSQLTNLDKFIDARRVIAKKYNDGLSTLPLTLPWQDQAGESAWHLYIIRLDLTKTDSHLNVFKKLRAAEIGVNLHYMPVYRQPYYEQFNFDKNDYPNAEQYYAEAISIPVFYAFNDTEFAHVISSLKQSLLK